MTVIENIRLSFQGIFSHKIRSFLTMLGIIIGIAAIIAIVSTIKGTNEEIKNNLIGSGENTVKITLMQGDSDMDFSWNEIPDGVPVIDKNVMDELKENKDIVGCTAYRLQTYVDRLFYNNSMLEGGTVCGVDENYFDTMGYQIMKGKGFADRDYSGQRKVCLINSSVVKSIFGDDDPVGKCIEIGNEPFTVLGVVVKSSQFEPVINSIDDYKLYAESEGGVVFIPSEAWPITFKFDVPQNIVIKAKNTDSMTTAGKAAEELLNSRLSVDKELNIKYKSENLLEQAEKMQKLSGSTNSMLIWIASISLLVGGIGVMNIMLVSVTERTREIGLKKALGARRGKILLQFLTEASVLTSIGGVIGVAAGVGLAQVISKMAEVPVAISTPAIIISVVFSMAVGIVFGLLPSIKAARLDPIDALRYE